MAADKNVNFRNCWFNFLFLFHISNEPKEANWLQINSLTRERNCKTVQKNFFRQKNCNDHNLLPPKDFITLHVLAWERKKNLLSQSTVRNWSSIVKLNRELGSQSCNHRLNFFGELLKLPWCSWGSIKIKLIFSWTASTILLLRLCDGIRSWDLYRFKIFIDVFSF